MANLQWHIGCSGFHYKEWKDVFYPKGLPQRLWLDHYCQHLNTPELYETLSQYHISFCGISHTQLPDAIICNTNTVYYRFHGVPQLYYSAYDEACIQKVVTAIQNAKQVKQAFIYFNNTAQTAAIQNARTMQQLVL